MMNGPQQDREELRTGERRNEPSVTVLVLRGIGIIIGAFLSAALILILHFPVSQGAGPH